VFYVFAAVAPSTGTFYRAFFGLPLLALVAFGERRRHGPLPRESIWLAALAGVFFTGDLMFWHHAIEAVGAGLATVLGNLQVIIVGVAAWLFLGERPSRSTLAALPIVLVGVVLISGVVGADAVRLEPAARCRSRDRDRAVLLGLPADHPPERPRRAAPGRDPWRSRRCRSSSARSSLASLWVTST
jgi:drug/metabolite transporter (DMT)-like permease